MYSTQNLFDLSHTLAGDYLRGFPYPHEALAGIGDMILSLIPTLGEDYLPGGENIRIHASAKIAPSASITGPCIIGPGTEVRPGAFIRGSALIGENCVVGNSTEIKNAILFNGVQVPHFNYVGDSILGYKAHFGAGSITSNVRSDKQPVVIHTPEKIYTNRKKVGAMVGDFAEIGCNAVLNPGTVVGRNAMVYPTACVRGVIPANYIWRLNNTITPRKDKE